MVILFDVRKVNGRVLGVQIVRSDGQAARKRRNITRTDGEG